MLTEAKKLIKFLLISTKYNIKSAFEYKKSFIMQTIFMFVNNGFFLIFWLVVIGVGEENASGIDMKQILYIWSIPTLAVGLADFFFNGISKLNKYIISGELDTYIIQPQNTLMAVATSKCSFAAAGDMLYGIVLGIYVSDTILGFLSIVFFAIMGMIIFCSATTIIRLLAIWVGDVDNVAHVYENSLLITFMTYPEQIFGKVTKFLMYTVIPAGYMVHMPIKILFNFNFKYLVIIIIATIFFAVAANLMFKFAMKKYESGNNIALRS